MKSSIMMLFSIVFFLIVIFIFSLNVPFMIFSQKSKDWINDIPIAHRGMHTKNEPENTIAAFQNAINKGYAIELDIQYSSDGEAVIFHDDTMERLTKLNGDINSYNVELLKNTKIGLSDYTIPTLKEVLNVVDGKVPIYIEIKKFQDISKFGDELYEIVKHYSGEYAIISFDYRVLSWFYKKDPEIIRGQTACSFDDLDKLKYLSFVDKFIVANYLMNCYSNPHFIIYDLKSMPNYVAKFLSFFVPLITYGTETLSDYKKAIKVGNNFMFDNIGDLIKEL